MPHEWTPQQKNAIEAQGGSVLVSAAAGSGKTAVLAERVIRMITSGENPVDADRLLVVTFTRDAAAEMKQRIAETLSKLLESDPFNSQLIRQSKLLRTASISTIDSFCGDLVREYFHALGVSADYRIADSSEKELMKTAAMDGAMEDFYNGGNAGFSALLDAFSGKGGDVKLRETVLKIHGFLETQPFPDQWLDDMLLSYGETDVKSSIWGKIMIDYALPAAAHCVNLCESSFKELEDSDAKLRDKLAPVIEDDLIYFRSLQDKLLGGDWDAIVTAVNSFSPKTLRAPKGYTDHPAKLAAAANRKNIKDTVARLKKYFCRTAQEAREEFAELQRLVDVLFALTRRYIERFDGLKRKKNVLTFSDIELLTVKLLAEYDREKGYIKTERGYEISGRFDAVIVDEFQDVNDVQNLIFNCVSRDETNLFVVGDVKQCIYGFRQAKPQIFVNRKESYSRYDENAPTYPATIILDKNFRSRSEVCDTVNFIFSRLMCKDTARMDYTHDEYLNPGFPYSPAEGCETELAVIDKTPLGDDRSDAELEASYIARRIRELMASDFRVTDGNEKRRLTFGDFAVMLRSAKNRAPVIVKTLINCGIPAYSEEKESAFDSTEVKIMLNYLRVIDNPAYDIPLLSVLCSPVYGFTPDELAQLRAGRRYTSLFSAVKAYGAKSPKAAAFVSQLAALRSVAYVSTVDELIGRVLEQTSLGAITCAVSGGDAPMKNLNLLRHFARSYESGGVKTLSDFVYYIDRVIENGTELPSASGGGTEAMNGVRVLSVHKSKGLEYPVCFLAGCAKRFNKMDLSSDVLIDNYAGLGIKRKSGVCRYNTLPRLAVEIEIERNELAEELRILYVALTRAREKLIIVGTVSKAEKYIEDMSAQLMFGSIIDPYTVTGSRRILDWITLCALVNPSSRIDMLGGSEQIALRESYPRWAFRLINSPEQLTGRMNTAGIPDEPNIKPVTEENYADILSWNLSYTYPHAAATRLPQKVSASHVSHADSGIFDKIIAKPAFLSKENKSAAERGTAHHMFLQFCDFESAREDMNAEIQRLVSDGALSAEQAELIDREGLTKLLRNPLFDRVLASDKVYREERFTVKIRPSLISEEYDGADEEIVMQGAVDLAFEENGRLVIADYKTDRVRDVQKLAELYGKQLRLYCEAMRQTLEIEISECLICSVALNEVTALDIRS